MTRLSRQNALKIAAVLSFLVGLYGFFAALPYIARGAAELSTASDSPPYFVIISGFVFSILRLVAAYGTWTNQRWGVVITIVTNAIDSVLALPGILFAPTMELWIGSIVGVVMGVVIIVLCLWRDPRPATA